MHQVKLEQEIAESLERMKSNHISAKIFEEAWGNLNSIKTLSLYSGQQIYTIPQAAKFLGRGKDYIRDIIHNLPPNSWTLENKRVYIWKWGLIQHLHEKFGLSKPMPAIARVSKQEQKQIKELTEKILKRGIEEMKNIKGRKVKNKD